MVYILSAIYISLSFGVNIELDKCCKNLSSIMGIDIKEDNCPLYVEEVTCCRSHGNEEKKCDDNEGHKDCDKKDIQLIVEDNHRAPVQLMYELNFQKFVAKIFSEPVSVFVGINKIQIVPRAQEPPDPLPVYIKYSSFTFYG